MKTRVVLTVDVEPSIAGAFACPETRKPLINEPVWGEISGRSEALGFIIRTLARYGLKATFFIETVHTAYFSPDRMGRYATALADAAQDVQLHLHPMWCSFRDGGLYLTGSVCDHCHEIEINRLTRLVEEGANQIEQWIGQRPNSMRTGNFSTNRNVFVALQRGGMRYSSNICIGVQMPPDAELIVMGGVYEIEGIVELPVTCFADRGPIGRGRPRPLQVTACSFAEIRAMLNKLHALGGTVAVIVTHPFEFLKSDDHQFSNMRPNRLVQSRFEQLCAFLACNTDRFQTEPLHVAAQGLHMNATPRLVGSPIHSMVRAAQNLINDRILQ